VIYKDDGIDIFAVLVYVTERMKFLRKSDEEHSWFWNDIMDGGFGKDGVQHGWQCTVYKVNGKHMHVN
jgi:hypothetical protein